MNKSDKIIEALKNHKDLPTLSIIHDKIVEVFSTDENIPIERISGIIKKDPALSARILKIANSPFYGFSTRIHSIDRAIVLMGSNIVKSILVGTYAFKSEDGMMSGLWEHSILSAIAARTLSRYILSVNASETRSVDLDNIFASAIMHDIGRVFIATVSPDDFKIIAEKVRSEGKNPIDIEKEVIGINHDVIGSMLMQQWNFPECIYLPVSRHHNPVLTEDYAAEAAILNIADILSAALGMGYTENPLVEPIRQDLMNLLHINEQLLKGLVYELYPIKAENLLIFD